MDYIQSIVYMVQSKSWTTYSSQYTGSRVLHGDYIQSIVYSVYGLYIVHSIQGPWTKLTILGPQYTRYMDFIGYMDYIGSSVFQGLPIVYSPEYTECMDSIESRVYRVHGLYRAQSIQRSWSVQSSPCIMYIPSLQGLKQFTDHI